MSSPSSRKRRATDAANALERVRELALVAAQNAPEPSYLDRPHKSSASAQPLITERQREKVVKYINEVRLRASPACPRAASAPGHPAPAIPAPPAAGSPHNTPPESLSPPRLPAPAPWQLAEDFELCVQTGTLACNYFDRYVASVSSPPAHCPTP